MTTTIEKSLFPVFRLLLRYFPSRIFKKWIYQTIVYPHLSWRSFRSIGRLSSGPCVNTVLPDQIQEKLYFFGVWEPEITDYISRTLRPGDTFIDVGANVGYFSLLAASIVGPSGRVIAIEASPSIHAELARNIEMNSFSNITAFNMAASNKHGVLPIFLGPSENRGASTTVSNVAYRKAQNLEAQVESDTLASIVGEATLLSARLIKIDVEGAELHVISGIANLLCRFSKATEWLVEVTSQALTEQGQSVDELFMTFRSAGYEILRIRNDYSDESYLGEVLTPYLEPIADAPSQAIDVLIRRK